MAAELRLWVILLGPNRGGAWGWIERRRWDGVVLNTREEGGAGWLGMDPEEDAAAAG